MHVHRPADQAQLEVRVVLDERRLKFPGYGARQLTEVDRLLAQLERARLQTGKIEEIHG